MRVSLGVIGIQPRTTVNRGSLVVLEKMRNHQLFTIKQIFHISTGLEPNKQLHRNGTDNSMTYQRVRSHNIMTRKWRQFFTSFIIRQTINTFKIIRSLTPLIATMPMADAMACHICCGIANEQIYIEYCLVIFFIYFIIFYIYK